MEVRLDGRSAIITGASTGPRPGHGEGVRRHRVPMSRSWPGGRKCWRRRSRPSPPTAKGGRVATFVCDVSKAEDIQKTFDGVIKAFGKVDILINNAGQSMAMPSDKITDEIWQRRPGTEAVRGDPADAAGVAGDEGAQVGAHHQRAEHRREGAAGERRADGGVARRGHGVHEGAGGRGRAARHSGERHAGGADRLRISTCGGIKREGANTPYEDFRAKMGANVPIGRMGKAEEFAAMACFLCSDHAGFTTGTAINMDGGASPVV